MEGAAAEIGSLKRKNPSEVRVAGVLDNADTSKGSNVMSKNNTAASNVIPFSFEERSVRTVMIGTEPWFAAKDIISSLGYAKSSSPAKLTEHVPEQWKGVNPIHTPGGTQKLLMLSEQGLYFFLGRSDKPKVLPFQMWVAGEVLPAIRKNGRYEDRSNQMFTLLGQTIGTDGFHCLGAVLNGKVRHLPAPSRKRAMMHVWSQVHKAFSVVSAQDIPAEQMDSARNFIAAYAIEGEWLEKEKAAALKPPLNIHYPLDALTCRRPGMLTPFNANHETLQVTLEDLSSPRTSFCEMILSELSRNGYAVEAAWWEFRTYRNKFEAFRGLVHNLGNTIEEPQNYVVNRNALPA